MNECILPHVESGTQSGYDEYRTRVAGTTIDNRTLLSTDYFNSFNEIIMLLSMVGDAPEILDDIRAWKFRTYKEHFDESNLDFGPLAIEAYSRSPLDVRERFESLVIELCRVIDEVRKTLTPPSNDDERRQLKLNASHYSRILQSLIETGSGIVHGSDMKMDQADIDKMF